VPDQRNITDVFSGIDFQVRLLGAGAGRWANQTSRPIEAMANKSHGRSSYGPLMRIRPGTGQPDIICQS
jgi:hypothetical protein